MGRFGYYCGLCKMSKKGGATSVEDALMRVDERILRDCHNLYTDPKDGLVTIAKELGIELIVPRKKINVLLIGNHSAGKSSFINWLESNLLCF